jgi:hypothetical protein
LIASFWIGASKSSERFGMEDGQESSVSLRVQILTHDRFHTLINSTHESRCLPYEEEKSKEAE